MKDANIDPTANVIALVELNIKRLDDLRIAELKRIDEKLELRAEFFEKLSVAEAKRIDAIRAVDINAVAVAAEKATVQATVLANQMTISTDTLRTLISSTATQLQAQIGTITTQFNDRTTALEKSQYEIRGTGTGRKDFYGYVIGGISILITVILFYLRLVGK